MQNERRKEWAGKAFRLAYFILEDREAARRAATDALARLEVASTAQFKRYYYTPTGRGDSSRAAARSRVTLGDLQLLQRLVLAGTEPGERDREAAGKADARAMLVHFVKHLVRIALKRNSFYVTLAVTRILHGYATSETLDLYNIVVQDPARVPDDYYCRSRKGLLMKELKSRFGELLKTVRGARGEERFEGAEATPESIGMARECLREFTPWNSACALPERFDPFADALPSFRFDKADPDEEHRIELNRIHALLHPDCFGRLTGVLRLPASEERMEIPGFMITNANGPSDGGGRRGDPPPDLRDDELEEIEAALRERAESRRAFAVGALLRVVADGSEAALIDPDGEAPASASFALGEEAEMIEIVGRRDGRDVLLAVHLLDHDALERGETRQSVKLENGRELTFDIQPTLDPDGLVSGFDCRVECTGNESASRVAAMLAGWRRFLAPLAAAAALVALVAGGFLLAGRYGRGDEIVTRPSPTPSIKYPTPALNPIPSPSPSAAQPSDSPVREVSPAPPTGPERRPLPARTPAPAAPRTGPTPRAFERRPPASDTARNEAVVDDAGVLRVPIYGSREAAAEPSRGGGGGGRRPVASSIGSVRKVFIDVSGDRVIGGMLRETLAAEIARRTRFRIVESREQADAALKVFVRHESDGDEPEDRSAAVIVRLVDAQGYVVYPTSRRVSGWKYVGVAVRLAARIADDLAASAPR